MQTLDLDSYHTAIIHSQKKKTLLILIRSKSTVVCERSARKFTFAQVKWKTEMETAEQMEQPGSARQIKVIDQ